jgi:hypothetical protein
MRIPPDSRLLPTRRSNQLGALDLPACYRSNVASRALDDAIEALKRDPTHPVRARVDDLTVELRAVPEPSRGRSAADVFREIGPWEGETLDELLTFFAEARRQGGSRPIADL